ERRARSRPEPRRPARGGNRDAADAPGVGARRGPRIRLIRLERAAVGALGDPGRAGTGPRPRPRGGCDMTAKEAILVASGDLRETANRLGWPAQAELEGHIEAAFRRHGVTVRRAHPFDSARGHGFISSQRMGMGVFESIDRDSPLIVAEAVWQYSHHVLAG